MTLPNFFLIGAGRCGSTSMHAYCRLHPQIGMSRVKEPNYFIFRDERPPLGGAGVARARRAAVRSARKYERLFAGVAGRPVIGESSISYLRFPRVCRAIREEAPGARLVILLRQPVDRAYSSFMGARRTGLEPCNRFEDAWADHERREAENWWHCMHKGKSLYYSQVRSYLEAFPREQVHIVLSEEFKKDPPQTMARVFSFLGVDPEPARQCLQLHNEGGEIDNWLLRRFWYGTAGLRSVLLPAVPLVFRGRLFPFVASRRRARAGNPPLAPQVRERFTRELRDEILRLQALIDRDLTPWLRSEREEP
jgi:hypothetical protein